MNPTQFAKRYELLAKPDSPERTAALLKELREWAQAAIHEAAKHCATPLNYFCNEHDVPHRLTNRLVSELNDYLHTHANEALEFRHQRDTPRYSKTEAIQIVTDAFHAFHPSMAEYVQAAAKEGRLSFKPSPSHAHQGFIGHCAEAPEDIAPLHATMRGLPYACTPCPTEKVSLDVLFDMAHEYGHLASAAECQKQNGNDSFILSQPLTESFSLMGERILHDHLLKRFANNAELYAQSEAAFSESLKPNLFLCAAQAQQELKILQKALEEMKRPDAANRDAFERQASVLIKNGRANRILLATPFTSLSYPLGYMASQGVYDQWKNGVPEVADRWCDLASSGKGYRTALEEMGISSDTPHFVTGALRDYETQTANLLASRLRADRAHVRSLEYTLRQNAPSASAPFAADSIIQVGAVALSDILRHQGKGMGKA